MLKLALIGLGRWGKHIQRTLKGINGVEVVAYDRNPPQPSFDPTSPQGYAGRGRGDIAGALIATPGSTHAEIALPFIRQGLPVFIEKPMATSLKHAQRLAVAAKKSGSQLFTGHIHLYNPAYLKLKALLPRIGTVQAIHFEGLAPGPVREDMSVLWDWGPHGVSLMLDLLGKLPKEVQGWGPAYAPASAQGFGGRSKASAGETRTFGHTAMAKLLFAREVTTTMHVSWVSPEKRVKLTVIGAKGALILDDTQPSHEASAGKLVAGKLVFYAGEKVSYPRYSAALPLTEELKAFIRMIKTGEEPKTGAQSGLDVVRVLEAIDRSIQLDGKKVAC